MDFIPEKERNTPVVKSTDVIVAGGGPAGLAAAVSAAESGADVLLIERNSFLGGVATAALMAVFVIGLDKLSGFSKRFIESLTKRGGAWTGSIISFDPETFKQLALDMVEESGSKLLLYANTVEPILEGNAATGVIVESKSGRQAIHAKRFIDATGDADLAARAGVAFTKGRERDGKMRPMTVLFRIGGVDIGKIVEYIKENPDQFTVNPDVQVIDLEKKVMRISGFFDLVTRARERGELDKDCHYIRLEGIQTDRGIAFVNSSRVYGVDGTDVFDLTKAEVESRKQIKQLMAFLNKYVRGCESAYLIDTSTSIGVRETRRIKGQYILTEDDIARYTNFDDSIATLWRRHKPGLPMHSPDAGEGSATDARARDLIVPPHPFQVPYRCLLPRDIGNMLVAGRSISVTHETDAFTRGMFCCMAFGEAAGAAAAISIQDKTALENVDAHKLREVLRQKGVNLDPIQAP